MKPDWRKGHQKIEELCNNMALNNKIDPAVMHLGKGCGNIKDLDNIRATLHGYLQSIEECYTNGRGSLVCIEFPPYRIWLTGGPSYGDAPTDLYYPVEMMNELSVLEATGLSPNIPNYRKMLNVIVKEKGVQSLLIGLDPDLNPMRTSRRGSIPSI